MEKWTREGGETDGEKSPSFSAPKDTRLRRGVLVNEGSRGKAKIVKISSDKKGLWSPSFHGRLQKQTVAWLLVWVRLGCHNKTAQADGSNNRNLFYLFDRCSRGWKSKVKVPAYLVPGESSLFLACR